MALHQFNRPNLFYEACSFLTRYYPSRIYWDVNNQIRYLSCPESHNQMSEIFDYIMSFYTRRGKPSTGLVYCRMRKTCDDLSAFLRGKGLNARPYHRGISYAVLYIQSSETKTHDEWKRSKVLEKTLNGWTNNEPGQPDTVDLVCDWNMSWQFQFLSYFESSGRSYSRLWYGNWQRRCQVSLLAPCQPQQQVVHHITRYIIHYDLPKSLEGQYTVYPWHRHEIWLHCFIRLLPRNRSVRGSKKSWIMFIVFCVIRPRRSRWPCKTLYHSLNCTGSEKIPRSLQNAFCTTVSMPARVEWNKWLILFRLIAREDSLRVKQFVRNTDPHRIANKNGESPTHGQRASLSLQTVSLIT